MKKAIGTLLATLLALALLVYSAMRSLDFISLTLPPDNQVLAYFGLAALDGGLVIWLLNFLYGAKGGYQRGISLLMIIVDFAGAVIMFTMDTLYNTGQAGMTAVMTTGEMQTAVLALSIIIALNIGATVAHHILDPDNRQRMAEEDARDRIEDEALKKISDSVPALAAALSEDLASDVLADIRSQYTSGLRVGRNGRAQLPKPQSAKMIDASKPPEITGNDVEDLPVNPTPPRRKKLT